MIPDDFYEVNFAHDLPPRKCQFCGKFFTPLSEDEYTCDKCAKSFNKKCTKKDFVTTNWEDKRMSKLWQKNYEKSMKSILSHCNGTKYENPKTK